MPEVSIARDIAAPAETVWSLVADITRMGEWSPESQGGSWQKGATKAVTGARFKGTNANGKKSWSTDCEITACEPGRTFEFVVRAGPFAIATWRYDFTPTDTGCHVTETWTDNRGGLAKFLGKFASGVADRESHNRTGMEQTLAALASVAVAE